MKCHQHCVLMQQLDQEFESELHIFITSEEVTGCLKITAARLGLSFGAGMGRARSGKHQ